MLHYFILIMMSFGFCIAKPHHGVTIYGDLKYKSDFKHFDYNNPTAPKGGQFRYSVLGNFDSLNPFIIKGKPAEGLSGLVFGSLMVRSADETSSQYAFIAESIDVAAEHKRVTFKLNPKACFSDGVKITSADVKFSIDILREKGSPLFSSYYKNIKTIETPDAHTVVFHMDDWDRELPVILSQIPVLPKHFYECHPFDETSLTPPPSSGPYVVKDVKAGEQVTFERIKNWWAENIPSQQGANNFDTIVYYYFRDDAAQFEAFKSGMVDFRYENSSKTWAIGYDFPAINDGLVLKKACDTLLPKPTYGIFMNTRRPVMSDKRVRRALTLLLDFEWLNKNVLYGIYKRNHSFFPVSVFEAKGTPDGAERELLKSVGVTDDDIFNTPYTLPVLTDQKSIRDNQAQAMDLFSQAGFHIQNQKMVDTKTNKPLTLELICSNPRIEKIALSYQNSLKAVGIHMSIRTLDNASYQERLSSFDYDLVFGGFQQTPTPGNEQRAYFGSKSADNQGSFNYAGVRSKMIDAIIERLTDVKNYAELTIATRALDRVLLHEYIMIPAWHFNGYMTAYWDRFGGTDTIPPYMIMGYPMTSWWYDADKAKCIDKKM